MIDMVKHLRIKRKIWVKLGEGEMNTCQIHDWIRTIERRGLSMQKLVKGSICLYAFLVMLKLVESIALIDAIKKVKKNECK